jgi:hypothetical protein
LQQFGKETATAVSFDYFISARERRPVWRHGLIDRAISASRAIVSRQFDGAILPSFS